MAQYPNAKQLAENGSLEAASAGGKDGADIAAISTAISLKRIADMLSEAMTSERDRQTRNRTGLGNSYPAQHFQDGEGQR